MYIKKNHLIISNLDYYLFLYAKGKEVSKRFSSKTYLDLSDYLKKYIY